VENREIARIFRNRRSDGDRGGGSVPHPQLSERRRRGGGIPERIVDILKDPRARSPPFPASARASRTRWGDRRARELRAARPAAPDLPPTALEFLKIQGLGPRASR